MKTNNLKYSYKSLSLVKTFLALMGFMVSLQANLLAQSQNNIWSLPPKYYDHDLALLSDLPNGPNPSDGSLIVFEYDFEDESIINPAICQ